VFPIAHQFYPIWFAQSSHVYKLKRLTIGKYICVYFAIGDLKRASMGRTKCSKRISNGSMNKVY
jgi:hypothetical protein